VAATLAWLVAAKEDVGLLVAEYLPEFLAISLLLAVFWAFRRRFGRDARPSH
jgi:hypothetical protein